MCCTSLKVINGFPTVRLSFLTFTKLIPLPDRYLPFSLSHEREDQYRFPSSSSHPSLVGIGSASVDPVPCDDTYVVAGFHRQAAFDSNLAINENYCEKPRDTTEHHATSVFRLIQAALQNTDVDFWAQTLSGHHIEVTVNDVDTFRDAFIKHLFSGACVLESGTACRLVATNEQSPENMGVQMIDRTLEWFDDGMLSLAALSTICRALDIPASASQEKRSFLRGMSSRRRMLLKDVDALHNSLDHLVPSMGCRSSVKVLKSVGAAHGLTFSKKDTHAMTTSKLLNHVTRGECVENIRGAESAPGCERLVSESVMRNENSAAFQVFILRHMIDSASRKLLINILELHEVVFQPGDTIKQLRRHLSKYVQSIERGKLKKIDDEYSAMERLRKLDEVRKNWPRMLPMAVKEQIVRDFRSATSSAALSSFTCVCCARNSPMTERVRKLCGEVNLDLLEGPSSHWNDSDFIAPPTPFQEGPLKNKLVDERGVTLDGADVILDLCKSCSRGLYRRSLPKHALANRLYVGPVPEELRDLTMVEESMIAQARAKSWIVKLQEQDADSASATAQRGLKGHTIIYPQQPEKLATVLPPPIGETLTYICVIFVGSSTLTKTWLREKAKPLVVRREKVRNALVWLKKNNPLYKDIEINEANLEALPKDDVLPYHIEHVENNDAQEALVSRYDNSEGPQYETTTESCFESVVVADVDAHSPVNQLRAAAVRHVKTKGKSFVRVGHGANPVNEFFNVELFPKLYPTLYPYGCGGFEDRARKKQISMKEHVKTLFSWHDRRFQTHYSFLFTVFNMLQRRALLLGCSLKVKKASFSRFAKQFSSVSSQAIARVLERVEKGEKIVPDTDEDRKVLRLMKEVNLVTSKVPGSSASRVAMRNEIRALTMTHGMPSFYVTINPADAHNPIVKFLAGEDIDLDDMLQDQIPNYWEQAVLLSTNPTIGARFFNQYLKAFVRTVLGHGEDGTSKHDGVLGTVKAHYGCVEAQGRGSLHCHMLIWVEGALNPNEIRQKVMKDPGWGKTLLNYLDDTITNVVPEDPIPDVPTQWDGKDPCALRGVNLELNDVEERLALRLKDMHNLAERVQRHRHSHTCYKYYKAGDDRKCRFDLKEENFRAESSVEQDTGLINLRCLDGLVNNFNMTMLEAVRCNMDIQFIGSGESAKAMIYYITDYITKSQLKSHVAYAALQMAVKKCEDSNDEEEDFTVCSKRLLQKCAYALISHQEMSAQQVASYLMDFEDNFTSHEFGNLYWAAFERYIEACDSEKLFPAHEGEGNGASRHEIDPDPDDNSMVDESNGEEIGKEDDETETLTGEDEEVVIHVESDGSITALTDQVADYTLRPRELNAMSLWDFVAKTNKFRGATDEVLTNFEVEQDGENDGQMGEVEVLEGDETDDEEEDMKDESETGDREKRGITRRGVRKVRRFRFLDGHGERDKKHIRMRAKEVVPVPIGPAMPRRDEDLKFMRYCRLMLILFKPWRSVADLREQAETWECAFTAYKQEMESHHVKILDNMQVLHECRDSRDDHMQTRFRQRSRGSQGLRGGGANAENDIEEIDMAEVVGHLEGIERMTSKKKDETTCETRRCIGRLTEAGFFLSTPEAGDTSQNNNELEEFKVTDLEDDNLEDEWRDTYERRKAAWKQETSRTEEEEVKGGSEMVGVSSVDGVNEDIEMVDLREVEEGRELVDDGATIMRLLVEKWTLNKEQKRAFDMVASHSLQEKPCQLLMYLGGPGGTGKSRVVNALRDFFEVRGQTRRFRLSSYTGVAARNIGGATLHSLLQMNESGRGISAKTKRDLAAMWEGVDYLFIDEVSMLGCEMLHNVSHALTEATGHTAAFGKINVILAGDFAQSPPIGDTRLYKDINTTTSNASATNRAQGKVLGRLLWLAFDKVVILHESMRQSGSENAKFVELLTRLRDGVCNENDQEILSGRILQRATLEKAGSEWCFAPVIVTNNATRDEINRRAAEAFALRKGRDLHWYHAIDSHRKVVIKDASLIEKLEGQNSGQTKHRLRTIPLVIGMPVVINQNFDVSAGVVNGSQGTLRKVRYFTDTEGRRHLRSCVVEIPNSEDVEIPHLPKHHFPVLPDTTDLKFEHGGSHKKLTIKRKQVPIEPGFAMTVHKAQGQTMPRVIVDLEGCFGTEQPYVMISRATSLDGLLVLREFNANQIKKRRSEDLRKEFARLLVLKWKTILNTGVGHEVENAKQKLEGLNGNPGKRKLVTGKVHETKRRKIKS